ncbi:hypothetical protein ABW21_db0207098 [Orbilia brochopaga]|nr:hypothetical protein ABW21_db0207098 [Drechslerella brochopaga]
MRNLNPDLDRFDDQGEDVIKETYDLFRKNLKIAEMQDDFRNVITAMMDATENYSEDDKKHRIWLFKWLLSQTRRNGARCAKRKLKARKERARAHTKRRNMAIADLIEQ